MTVLVHETCICGESVPRRLCAHAIESVWCRSCGREVGRDDGFEWLHAWEGEQARWQHELGERVASLIADGENTLARFATTVSLPWQWRALSSATERGDEA